MTFPKWTPGASLSAPAVKDLLHNVQPIRAMFSTSLTLALSVAHAETLGTLFELPVKGQPVSDAYSVAFANYRDRVRNIMSSFATAYRAIKGDDLPADEAIVLDDLLNKLAWRWNSDIFFPDTVLDHRFSPVLTPKHFLSVHQQIAKDINAWTEVRLLARASVASLPRARN